MVKADTVQLTVDETNFGTDATASFAASFTALFGNDGPLDANHDGVADAGAVTYALSVNAGATGLVDTLTGEAVNLVLNGGVVEGRTATTNLLVFTVSVDGSGTVTLDQSRSVVHPTLDPNEPTSLAADNLVTLTATVTDGDGDTDQATLNIGQNLTFLDDGPSIGTFTTGVIPNEIGSVAGFFSLAPGADGLDHFNITGPAISGITYVTTVAPDGTTTLHGQGSGGIDAFSLTVASDGTYHFDLFAPQLATSAPYDLTALPSGGPSWRQTTDGRIEFSSPDGINSSGAGFGVANQWTGGNESFTMEFHNPGQAGDQLPSVNPEFNDSVTINVAQINGGGGTYNWTAVDTVHNITQHGSVVITAAGAVLIDPTISFNELTIQADNVGGQGIRITSMTVSKTILPSDQSYDFHVTAVDGDGDTTATQTLHIDQVAAGNGGAYTLDGTTGDDVIAGSSHADTISGEGGFDIVDYTGSAGAISIHLADDGHASGAPGDPANPSVGTIGGGDAVGDKLTGINGLIGGAGNDVLFGNVNDNYLAGGKGNDTLRGGGGHDTFAFNSPADNGFDTIKDFLTGADELQFSGSAFGGLTAGTLDAEHFSTVDTAGAVQGQQAGPEFVFNNHDSTLYYDADGSGAGAAIAMAKLENVTNLQHTDIHIV